MHVIETEDSLQSLQLVPIGNWNNIKSVLNTYARLCMLVYSNRLGCLHAIRCRGQQTTSGFDNINGKPSHIKPSERPTRCFRDMTSGVFA